MKYLSLIANLLVGLTYTIFGLNGFFHFIELPEMNADSAAFTDVLMSTGFFAVIKVNADSDWTMYFNWLPTPFDARLNSANNPIHCFV